MRSRLILFTYDKRFRQTGITTPRRLRFYERLKDALTNNNLLPEQVVLLEGSRKYVAESPSLVRSYLEQVDFLPESTIFTDQGHAFFQNRVSVIETRTSARSYTYPPSVHQYLSPNDNHYHGAAKARWRSIIAKNGWGPEDAIESELCLLGLLTHTEQETIRSYFAKNLFFGRGIPNTMECLRRILDMTPRQKKRKLFFEKCMVEFREFDRSAQPSDTTTSQ